MESVAKMMTQTEVPKHLWQCESFAEQKAWCKARFESGTTLSDPHIWLGGADPDKIVRALRRDGMPLETCRVTTIDAAGTAHPKTLAWRLTRNNQ